MIAFLLFLGVSALAIYFEIWMIGPPPGEGYKIVQSKYNGKFGVDHHNFFSVDYIHNTKEDALIEIESYRAQAIRNGGEFRDSGP